MANDPTPPSAKPVIGRSTGIGLQKYVRGPWKVVCRNGPDLYLGSNRFMGLDRRHSHSTSVGNRLGLPADLTQNNTTRISLILWKKTVGEQQRKTLSSSGRFTNPGLLGTFSSVTARIFTGERDRDN